MVRLLRLALVLFLLAPAASAQLQGVGYRFAPAAGYVWFDGDAGLTDGVVYGGGIGISFGEFVELGGTVLVGNDFRTDFSRFGGLEDAPEIAAALQALPAQSVGLQRVGTELTLRLGRAGLSPSLTGGVGLMRFDPEARDASDVIYVTGGAGVQLTGADRYALSVRGGVLAYRYNPGSTFFTPDQLAAVGLTYGSFNAVQVLNPYLEASLQLYLGGRRAGQLTDIDRAYLEQFSGGLGGLSLQFEPFYARLSFDDLLPYRDQSFVGVEAGTDFGPLVGLRAYFARGTASDDPFSFEPVQLYGGHLRLRLSEGTGLVPFVTVGAGYLDVLDGYASASGGPVILPGIDPEDRFFAQGGVGVDFSVTPRLRVQGEWRALVLSDQRGADVSRPEQVYLNPMLRVGASFGLGGDRVRAPEVIRLTDSERRLQDERLRSEERAAELETEIARAVARGDSLAAARLAQERDLERRLADVRAQALREEAAREAGIPAEVVTEPGRPTRLASEVRTAQGDRIVTIPLPETGELYVRYGEPGGVEIRSDGSLAPRATAPAASPSEDDLRLLIREALQEALGVEATAPAAPAAPGEPAPTGLAPVQPAPPQPVTSEAAQVQALVEQLLRQEAARGEAQLSAAERQLLERRLTDRLFDEVADLRRELRGGQQPIVIAPPPAPTVIPAVDPATGLPIAVRRTGFFAASPVSGLALGAGPNQVTMGVRLDYRADGTPFGLRYYPEVLLGFGGERSAAINFNGIIPFPIAGPQFLPYGGVGLGLISYNAADAQTDVFGDPIDTNGPPRLLLALNTVVGTEYLWGNNTLFVETTAVNLTRFYRMQVGYRFGF